MGGAEFLVPQPTEGRPQQGGWRSLCGVGEGQLSLQVTVPSTVSPEARARPWVALCADWNWSDGGGGVGRTGRAGRRVKLWFSQRGAKEASQEATDCSNSSAHTPEDRSSQAWLGKGF